jgi:hypothetical protein
MIVTDTDVLSSLQSDLQCVDKMSMLPAQSLSDDGIWIFEIDFGAALNGGRNVEAGNMS